MRTDQRIGYDEFGTFGTREGKRWLRHYFEKNSRFLCADTGNEIAQKGFHATILGKTSNFSA